ncbi:MAG: DUF4340 domain-containing protein [Chloroflexota bacterium]
MPRQVREAAPAARPAGARRTVFGVPWRLPLSPVAVGLLIALVVAAAAAWYFEGRYEITPAQAAKLLLPYKTENVQQVVLTTPSGSVTYTQTSPGEFSPAGVASTPTPAPTPAPIAEATPAPVQLSPGTKLEGILGQVDDLSIDRVVASQPSTSAEFGLDAPRLTLTLTPKRGAPSTIAIGGLNPDESAYYVRRESRNDTVLVTKYTLDDLIEIADELIQGQ